MFLLENYTYLFEDCQDAFVSLKSIGINGIIVALKIQWIFYSRQICFLEEIVMHFIKNSL